MGESPEKSEVNRPDLWLLPDESGYPHAANRLIELTGWTIPQFLRIFPHRTNVWPSPNHMHVMIGRARARKICEDSLPDRVVVLGVKAAEMFGIEMAEQFQWVGRFVRIPHPSGQCRYWSDPENCEIARRFFATLDTGQTALPRHGA